MFTKRLLKIKIHSRRVQIFKRSLPIFAFLLASMMMIWPTLMVQKDKFSLAVKPTDVLKDARVDMKAVRFFAQDDKNQPMTVIADSVQETDPAKQIITLAEPKATYKMENGVLLRSVTTYGLAFQQEQYLYFEEEVITTTDTGWKAFSSEVICDYKEGTLESAAPVKITGPDGDLKAQGFLLYDKGNHIDFRGKTNVLMTSQKDEIYLTSTNGLKIDQLKQTITAFQNVVVTQKNQKITADTMVLYYRKDVPEGASKIEKIIATGNVVATNTSQKITGKTGVYNPMTSLITMVDDVVLTQGKNVARGTKVSLNLLTGVSSLTATNKEGKKERVKGTLIPADLK